MNKMTTIASIPRMQATTLSQLILQNTSSSLETRSPLPPDLAIIDVRDDDHIGGHIRGSMHRPSVLLRSDTQAMELASPMENLVKELRGVQTVVFHCALSQQRGVACALEFVKEKEKAMQREKEREKGAERGKGQIGEQVLGEAIGRSRADGSGNDREGWGVNRSEGGEERVEQKVYILDRGFVGWQEMYGEDTRLTEGFRKEIWK